MPSKAAQPSSTRDAADGPSEPTGIGNNLTFIAQLETAATAADRLTQTVVVSGKGGHTVHADRKIFPDLIGTGVSMTVGLIGPCGINTPHTHPRSSEVNIVVKSRLGTNYIAENGASLVINTLDTYQMTVFPQGSVHTEFNPDCEPAVFVAGFASEDPGVQHSAQTFFSHQEAVIGADMGIQSNDIINGEDIESFKGQISANVAMGVESCLKKCNISKKKKT